MKLFLIRHGETIWNAVGKIQGKSNTHLSKKGKLQAKQIAKILKREKIDAIYSSNLKRAKDTAIEIAKFHDKKIVIRKELQEVNYGMFEGMTFDFIDKNHADLWQKRRKNKYKFKPKNGESFREMDKNRVKPFLKELFKKHSNQIVAIVAHSGTNRLLMGNLLGLSNSIKSNIWQPNECYYILECNGKKCSVWRRCIGQAKRTAGYFDVKDMNFWGKIFK